MLSIRIFPRPVGATNARPYRDAIGAEGLGVDTSSVPFGNTFSSRRGLLLI